MLHYKIKNIKSILAIFIRKPLLITLLVFTVIIIYSNSKINEMTDNIPVFEPTELDSLSLGQNKFNALTGWELLDQNSGGPNSFVTINYDKCIPVAQCKFDDCNIEGSFDGNGNYCLPVNYSDIGDWAPNFDINLLGVSLFNNPSIYQSPVEHTQASARLPDQNGNAYFMFSTSQNYYGLLWVVEVEGIDKHQPQHFKPNMPARVVWWQRLNKCQTKVQCNNQYNPGNFNHPARISRVENTLAIAFQNYSFTLEGKFKLAKLSPVFQRGEIPIPKPLETSTLPFYPEIRSADAIAFYDVSDPKNPKFSRKIVGNEAELWGGYPPGRDISEVSLIKVGSFYHMNVSGDLRNAGNNNSSAYGISYKLNLPYTSKTISPLLGDVSADVISNITEAQRQLPVKISLNPVIESSTYRGFRNIWFGLELIATEISYNNSQNYIIDETTHSAFQNNEAIFSTNIISFKSPLNSKDFADKKMVDQIKWMADACNRAWGFQMLDSGAYNVICHDSNPEGSGLTSQGRFVIRGVSANQPSG